MATARLPRRGLARRLTSRRSLLASIAWLAVILVIFRVTWSPLPDFLPQDTWSQRPLTIRHVIDSIDAAYRPVTLAQPPSDPFPKLGWPRTLPSSCLEAWLVSGELQCNAQHIGPEVQLDASWLWVNGSDPRWRTEMEYWRRSHGVYSPEHHYRDFNELVYSMRSVLAALQGHLRAVHLVLYDFAFVAATDLSLFPGQSAGRPDSVTLNALRIAQTPTWLDIGRANESTKPQLRYALHSEIFHLPTTVGADEAEQLEWRRSALPSFNSMSIESRLGWLPDLSEVSIALNDDMFMLLPHAVSDFHSLFYGNVVLLDPNWYQQARPVLDKSRINDAGQIGGLYHANFVLSQRFAKRRRPGVVHGPKVVSRDVLHETNIMFQNALSMSSSRRFRELFVGNGDIHMLWLATLLRIERWREALLWTYTVARIGATAGTWGDDARRRISTLFAAKQHVRGRSVQVNRGKRSTLSKMPGTFRSARHGQPLRTQFTFTSLDGHLPSIVEPGRDPMLTERCSFDLDRCLGVFWTESQVVAADHMFKRLAFEHPHCGDCLIMALVNASGKQGLSAFFPPSKAVFRTSRKAGDCQQPPHLPLTPTWEQADFSLQSVLSNTTCPGAKVRLREYTARLLSRYLYVSGRTDEQFHMLQNTEQTRGVIETVDSDTNASLLGLNDDVDDAQANEVKSVLGSWFQSKWPTPAPWER